MKRILIVLMAAVLVAGCTGQGPISTTTDGLKITSFTSDADSQMSGRDIRLFLEIENAGEAVAFADNIVAYLGGPVGTDLLQWQLMESSSPNGTSRAVKPERNLEPKDVLKEIPAGRTSVRWRIRAPQMDPGQQKVDTFNARVYYDYETRVVGEVKAYAEAESIAMKQRGENVEKAVFTTTSGPLGVSIRSIPDPVVVTEGNETMTLEIVVQNGGGGTIYKPGITSKLWPEPSLNYSDLNVINMTVNAGGLALKGTCNGPQELIGGKPTTLTCDVEVPMPATKASYPVKITLEYGYYIDQSIQLTAIGKT